ncbi:hypothetical protein DERF_009058 [Dermatophagoides farinae]|uniref:Uncharacterized protein n=1 Tax=Dermatophagoides farinae TaxID=6954 RepID=A0A922L3M5_DERFA|nr:hypothetical protein DERF_009058 [Dermatophagoides farinae]
MILGNKGDDSTEDIIQQRIPHQTRRHQQKTEDQYQQRRSRSHQKLPEVNRCSLFISNALESLQNLDKKTIQQNIIVSLPIF